MMGAWPRLQLRRVLRRIEQGWSPECHSRPAEANEWGVLRAGCTNGGVFDPAENKALPSDLDPIPSLEVRHGDVLMSRASGSPQLIGSVAVLQDPPSRLMLSDKIFRLEIDRSRCLPQFLAYALSTTDARRQIQSAISGAAGLANNLPQSEVRALELFLPTKEVQFRVVAVLDRKTTVIDELIAKKEGLLFLLGQKKQALVDRVLTRGLSAAPLLKPTDLPWVPAAPETWRVVRLKHLGTIRPGITLGREVRGELLEARPYLRVANVQNGYLRLDDISTIEVTHSEAARCELRPGDVLMNEGGDNDKLGRGYVWEGQVPGCLHQNHVFAVRLKKGFDPYWVNFATQASYLRDYFLSRAKQSTNLASISARNLGEAPVLVPSSHAEATELVKYLQAALSNLQKTASLVEASVSRLREYRQTLITAAVTGQIDVTQEAA